MLDLEAAPKGSVEAPAGCGKTQAIVDLAKHPRSKPLLILTHTNAGVAALRSRLMRAEVPVSSYRLTTLDGWSQRIVRAFPMRAEFEVDTLTALDFSQIRRAALRVLRSGALDLSIVASYSGVLVDEYQDCDTQQHSLVLELAIRLPARIFGDPMQAIFDFKGEPRVPWQEVTGAFPPLPSLCKPWRWENAKAPLLGNWLLQVHEQLKGGGDLDISSAPREHVRWVFRDPLNYAETEQEALREIRPPGKQKLIIIGHTASEQVRHRFARQTPGVGVVERADLPDLEAFAVRLALGAADDQLSTIVHFAESVMTCTGSTELAQRIATLRKGKARKEAERHEAAALAFLEEPSPLSLSIVLESLSRRPKSRVFRLELLYAMLDVLAVARDFSELRQRANAVRNRRRFTERTFPRLAIGTTLLVKGLEADHVLILDADALETTQHLYVAITRGARRLTLLSSDMVIKMPARNMARAEELVF